jgi:hypothetical protein
MQYCFEGNIIEAESLLADEGDTLDAAVIALLAQLLLSGGEA